MSETTPLNSYLMLGSVIQKQAGKESIGCLFNLVLLLGCVGDRKAGHNRLRRERTDSAAVKFSSVSRSRNPYDVFNHKVILCPSLVGLWLRFGRQGASSLKDNIIFLGSSAWLKVKTCEVWEPLFYESIARSCEQGFCILVCLGGDWQLLGKFLNFS